MIALGVVNFIQQQFSALGKMLSVVQTPFGALSVGYVLLALMVIALAVVIYAHIDDRKKKRR